MMQDGRWKYVEDWEVEDADWQQPDASMGNYPGSGNDVSFGLASPTATVVGGRAHGVATDSEHWFYS